jgi:hypothetical protein
MRQPRFVTVVENKNSSLLTFLTILGTVSGIIQFVKVTTDGSISAISSFLNMIYFGFFFHMQWNDARYSPGEKRKLVFPQVSGFVASAWNLFFALWNGTVW